MDEDQDGPIDEGKRRPSGADSGQNSTTSSNITVDLNELVARALVGGGASLPNRSKDSTSSPDLSTPFSDAAKGSEPSPVVKLANAEAEVKQLTGANATLKLEAESLNSQIERLRCSLEEQTKMVSERDAEIARKVHVADSCFCA